jgi:signal peptidase II
MTAPDLSSKATPRKIRAAMLALGLAVAVVTLALDQASKWVILTQVMSPPRVIEVLPVFNLVLTFNQGISFGLFSGETAWQPYLLSALALAISAGLFTWLARQPSRHLAIAVGLIVGGAVGNVIDRIRIAAVVDFLDFHWGDWHWPAFNVADSAITLGVVCILLVDILFDGGAKAKVKVGEEEEL